jgi:uncharacterized protein (TIGR03086 family)
MNEQGSALAAGVALLERAIDYTLGSLRIVTTATLCRATPCARWDVQALLAHMHDSFEALNEAATGDIGADPVANGRASPAHGRDPALLLRDGATAVLGTWAGKIRSDAVSIGGCAMTTPMVAAVGAIEITVHGWDVARSCGEHRPIPPLLAEELLDLVQLFVTWEDRPFRFAAPLPVPGYAPAQDHLLAYLGRDPNWRPLS